MKLSQQVKVDFPCIKYIPHLVTVTLDDNLEPDYIARGTYSVWKDHKDVCGDKNCEAYGRAEIPLRRIHNSALQKALLEKYHTQAMNAELTDLGLED